MSQTPVSASGLVRVSVSSGSRRVDLVLPGSVPVAELASRSDEELRATMKGSAMKRAGVKGLRRNLEASLRHA